MFLKLCKYERLDYNCITARVIQVYMVFYICNGVLHFFILCAQKCWEKFCYQILQPLLRLTINNVM